MNELISVIIPVYNVEQYVESCLNSVINQSYTNLEIILVDDGSTDRSGEVCDQYALKDNRIKVIHEENAGLGEARNRGVRIASGDYICFVDSDDWIEEDYCKELVKAAERTNSDIAICGYNECFKDGKTPKVKYDDCFTTTGKEILHYTMTANSKYWFNISVWNKLYKREIISGLWFKSRVYEDIMYNAESMYKANKIAYINQCLYNYRTNREGSIISKGFQRKTIEFEMKFKEERVDFFKRNNEIKLARYAEAVVIHDKLLYYAFMSLSKDNYSEYIKKYKEDLRKCGFIADTKTNIALLIFKCFPQLWIKIIKKKYKY